MLSLGDAIVELVRNGRSSLLDLFCLVSLAIVPESNVHPSIGDGVGLPTNQHLFRTSELTGLERLAPYLKELHGSVLCFIDWLPPALSTLTLSSSMVFPQLPIIVHQPNRFAARGDFGEGVAIIAGLSEKAEQF